MVLGCSGQKLCLARCGQGAALMCTILIAIGLVGRSNAGPIDSMNPFRQADSNFDYDRWMTLDGQEPTGLAEDPRIKEHGENEYWDNYLFREGISQVEPKKKPLQFRLLSNLKPRRKQMINTEERMAAKRDLNGMSMSITHNLDILRRGLLRELNMRQREQDRKQNLENNKKFLNGLGK